METKTKEEQEKRREEVMKKALTNKSIQKPDLMKRFGDFDLRK